MTRLPFTIAELTFLLLAAYVAMTGAQTYHSEELVAGGRFTLHWGVTNASLEVKVVAATTGWIGVGFSPNGGMPGSDIVMGWINGDGSVAFSDRHTKVNDVPSVDAKQNYELLELSEAGGKTTMRFRRAVASCDSDDAQLLGTARVIFAWGEAKPVGGVPAKHLDAHRGTRLINILNTAPLGKPPTESDAWAVPLSFNGTLAPAGKRTRYVVAAFELPLTTKAHMVGYEVVIPDAERVHSHHLMAYLCNFPLNGTDVHYKGLTTNQPAALRRCGMVRVVVGWASGTQATWFHADVGIPVGQDENNRFIVLEIHLDVPDTRADVSTSATVNLWFTRQLRPLDGAVAIFAAMVDPFLMLPPGAASASRRAFCASECTETSVGDMQIFGSLLHAHGTGIAIAGQHISANGTELPLLASDQHFSPDLQQWTWLPEPCLFKRGDRVTVTCRYNTAMRTRVTIGGGGAEDEMCFIFSLIAPTQPSGSVGFSGCFSTGTAQLLGSLAQASAFGAPAPALRSNLTAFVEEVTDWSNFEPAFGRALADPQLPSVQPICILVNGSVTLPSARPALAFEPSAPYVAPPVACPTDIVTTTTTTTTTSTVAATTTTAVTTTTGGATTKMATAELAKCSDEACCKKIETSARPCSECAATDGCAFFGAAVEATGGGRCMFAANATQAASEAGVRIKSPLECADLCAGRACDECIGGDPSQPQKTGVAGCVWCEAGRASLSGSPGSCEVAACALGDVVQQRTCLASGAAPATLSIVGALLVAVLFATA